MEFAMPLGLLLIVPLLYLWWRLGRGTRSMWPIRIAVLCLCAVMFVSPSLRVGSQGRHFVFVIDRSQSAGDQAIRAGSEMLALASANRGDQDRISVVLFGDGASLALGEGGAWSELRPATLDDASDLHAALNLAGALCGEGGERLLLVSDGLYTGRDPRELIPELHKGGVSVNYWPVQEERRDDVAVMDVRLPERVHVGRPFEVTISVASPRECEAVLSVRSAAHTVRKRVRLAAGESRFVLRDAVPQLGLARYVVTVEAEGDTCPQNNRALAVTQVAGPPEVLVVNAGHADDNLTQALRAAGLRVRLWHGETPLVSAALQSFQAVVLENVPLSALNDRADAALRNYVEQSGGGLLVTGGVASFAGGGYYMSRLDPILPVSMEQKERYRRPPLAMAIVLDRSGSMRIPVRGGLTKMDLANRAAAEAVALLLPQDEVAVYAVDSMAHEVVGLTRLSESPERVRKRILGIESQGGGIFVHTGLRAGIGELLKSQAPTRHVVLFADAADSEEQQGCADLVQKWAAAGGTLSVIGLGTPSDTDAAFLRDLAGRGGGSVFFTSDPEALPRIFCEDALRVARRTFLEQETHARLLPGLTMLGKLQIERFPAFDGYNLCYLRPAAEELIRTTDDNSAPVLAVWQRGLGRVAALTCEADGPYAGELARWDGYKPFFTSVVKWLQKQRADVGLFGTTLREGRTATVLLEMDSETARRCTGATAVIIPPDEGDLLRLPMHWTSPETMEATFMLRQNGVYHGLILTGNESKRVDLPAVVLPYSPEFEPRPVGSGLAMLKDLASATGGGRLMRVDDLFKTAAAHLTGTRARQSLAPAIAGLLLLLLLADILTRKALWAHLVPRFAQRGYAAAGQHTVRLSQALRERWRRRRLDAAARKAGPAAPPSEQPPERPAALEESVFRRAKKRSRR